MTNSKDNRVKPNQKDRTVITKPNEELLKDVTVEHLVTIIGIYATEHTDAQGNTWFNKKTYKRACDYLAYYLEEVGVKPKRI